MGLISGEPGELGWAEALAQYRYPVKLQVFAGRSRLERGWFEFKIDTGDRAETIQFEEHFRQYAASQLTAWYEVIFWKMASQRGRADLQAARAIDRFAVRGTSASDLWSSCTRYVAIQTKESFHDFQTLLFDSTAIAIAFTFPAFCCPSRIPMVDTRIARYLASEGARCGFPIPLDVEKTLKRYRPNGSGGVLSISDWPFVEAWVGWCQKVAGQLPDTDDLVWRARDVEMAVFRAWGEAEEREEWPKHLPRHRLPYVETSRGFVI